MKTQKKQFNKAVLLRLSLEDAKALEQTAERLNLRVSEIARRAIRVGVRSLNEVNLPGARMEQR